MGRWRADDFSARNSTSTGDHPRGISDDLLSIKSSTPQKPFTGPGKEKYEFITALICDMQVTGQNMYKLYFEFELRVLVSVNPLLQFCCS